MPPALEARSLNHRTAREAPYICPSLPQAFAPAWPALSLNVTSSPKERFTLFRRDDGVVIIFFFLKSPFRDTYLQMK